ncbi:HIG1 domain-containing protein [Qipengyuania sp. 1NDH17]|uniref:HIG1 domain-containing protein n=1 Tax=Qipengyuania polymorpha TaxID=2867234 RepID=A0ABS7IZF2_9SPHN|nr:HIG1 domain-containing protein [Qipengyuania polymorpha]MBX7458941.1 HIG1 domain-containing protein [Qipengyuania polymorpha]
MNTFLVILLVAAMAMVLFSLIRGVVAFLQSTKVDLQTGEQVDATEMQLKQNRAMMARVKWQAVAIVIIAILLGVAT